MPGTPTIKGDSTVLFGSGGLYATGIVARGRIRKTSDVVLVPDNNGYDIAKVYFNEKEEAEVEIIVQTAAPALAQGDEATIKSVAGYLVDETEEMWDQKNVRKYTFRATRHTGMTLA